MITIQFLLHYENSIMATRRGLSVDDVLDLLDEDGGDSESDDEFDGYLEDEVEIDRSGLEEQREADALSDEQGEESSTQVVEEVENLESDAEQRVTDEDEENSMEADSTHGNRNKKSKVFIIIIIFTLTSRQHTRHQWYDNTIANMAITDDRGYHARYL